MQVNDYPIDPNIQLIRVKIANTPYSEDADFCIAMEDFYQTGPKNIARDIISEIELVCVLQDQYSVSHTQAKIMIQTMKDMKIIRIDEDGIMRS